MSIHGPICTEPLFVDFSNSLNFFLYSDPSGQRTIQAKVPDTITSWHLSAFAMSSKSGIGVSNPSLLTVFQPFFVSFTLPYSVIRGEQVSIVTTVFNYMTKCATVCWFWVSWIGIFAVLFMFLFCTVYTILRFVRLFMFMLVKYVFVNLSLFVHVCIRFVCLNVWLSTCLFVYLCDYLFICPSGLDALYLSGRLRFCCLVL